MHRDYIFPEYSECIRKLVQRLVHIPSPQFPPNKYPISVATCCFYSVVLKVREIDVPTVQAAQQFHVPPAQKIVITFMDGGAQQEHLLLYV